MSDELDKLAPEDPTSIVPDWEGKKREMLTQITATSPRSGRRAWSVLAAAAAIAVVVGGVFVALQFSPIDASSPKPAEQPELPKIEEVGTRSHDFRSLEELAEKSNAVVIAEPTGETHSVPLPDGFGSAPTPYVTMQVTQVLSGEVKGDVIDVVSPGIDRRTQEQVLSSGGPWLLFLAPAMYGANDPAGGYAVVGGPAGVYLHAGGDVYWKIDAYSEALPEVISTDPNSSGDASPVPEVTKTEEQLLAEGPGARPETHLPTMRQASSEGPQAQIEGEIRLVEGCVLVGEYPTLWPAGSRLTADEMIEVGRESFAIGDHFSGGGGYLARSIIEGNFDLDEASRNALARCAEPDAEVAVIYFIE